MSLAQRFPDRVLIVAGGNQSNFFYDARLQLEQKLSEQGQTWPENLIIVGVIQETIGENTVEADGADVYVFGSDFQDMTNGGDLSSSEATAIVSAVAAAAENYIADELQGEERAAAIRDFVLSETFTDEGEYIGVDVDDQGNPVNYPTRNARVLNMQEVQQNLSSN